jgi:LmbE family N-acetylglucosaminyl deacetylase
MTDSTWIFISPHFDDVVLSCGALVWSLTQEGQPVEIWTVMGGYPADEVFSPFADAMHQAWGLTGHTVVEIRRAEDRAACEVLGAQPRHWDWPDVIYRRDSQTHAYSVNNNTELFGNAPNVKLVTDIASKLTDALPVDARIVLPIGLGSHVDHRTVVQAGKKLAGEKHYYADYPYVLTDFNHPLLLKKVYQPVPQAFKPEALTAWQDAILCYDSQVGEFWRDEAETRLALRNYFSGGGGRLWQKKTPA